MKVTIVNNTDAKVFVKKINSTAVISVGAKI